MLKWSTHWFYKTVQRITPVFMLHTPSANWFRERIPWTGSRLNCILKSQLLSFGFYLVLAQFEIKRARFSLVFIRYVLFFTLIVLLLKKDFSASNVFSLPQKVIPHAQRQPVKCFTSHQKLIDLNDRWKLQSTPNKVLIFESSSNH